MLRNLPIRRRFRELYQLASTHRRDGRMRLCRAPRVILTPRVILASGLHRQFAVRKRITGCPLGKSTPCFADRPPKAAMTVMEDENAKSHDEKAEPVARVEDVPAAAIMLDQLSIGAFGHEAIDAGVNPIAVGDTVASNDRTTFIALILTELEQAYVRCSGTGKTGG